MNLKWHFLLRGSIVRGIDPSELEYSGEAKAGRKNRKAAGLQRIFHGYDP